MDRGRRVMPMQKDNGRSGKKRDGLVGDGAHEHKRGPRPPPAPPRRWRSGDDDRFHMEDLRQPEMVARSSLYLGIIAAVITLITLILAAVPFGDSLMCLIWPLLLLGAIAVLGGIGLGVAGTLMGARNKSAATMGIVLSGLSVAVFIIGNAIVEVAF